MSGFTKLFSSIVTSSIWVEDDSTLRVWIAMLASADAHGVVDGSVPGFANLARVSVEEMRAALKVLSSPDEYSRSPENEGRRIESIEGGWLILNHSKYREKRDPEERKQQVREAVARHRSKKRHVINVIPSKPKKAEAEAEAEAEDLSTHARANAEGPKTPPKASSVRAFDEDRDSEFAVWWDEELRELQASEAFWAVARSTYAEWPTDVVEASWTRLSLWLRENDKRLEALKRRGLCEWVQSKLRQDATNYLQRVGIRDGPPLATPMPATADEMLADQARKRRKAMGG